MKQVQINRVEMFQDTNNYMDENVVVWSAIPIAGTYKNALAQIIEQLNQAAQDQIEAKVNVGKNRKQLKRDIGFKMDVLDDILEAYASDTGNAQLEQEASNSPSDYFRLKNEEFEIKTVYMLNLLDKEVANLSEYGMTPQMIEDVKINFNTFSDQSGKPRTFKIASRVATGSIEDLIKAGNETLARLDNVLKRFRRSNATFHRGYEASRMVVDD